MTTAILTAVALLIAVALFYAGAIVGGYVISKQLAKAMLEAINESDLTDDEQLLLLEKIKQKVGK